MHRLVESMWLVIVSACVKAPGFVNSTALGLRCLFISFTSNPRLNHSSSPAKNTFFDLLLLGLYPSSTGLIKITKNINNI
jgi:hypothetical protein